VTSAFEAFRRKYPYGFLGNGKLIPVAPLYAVNEYIVTARVLILAHPLSVAFVSVLALIMPGVVQENLECSKASDVLV
jgi:hypothetical protein